jgi:hypothetical protein
MDDRDVPVEINTLFNVLIYNDRQLRRAFSIRGQYRGVNYHICIDIFKFVRIRKIAAVL